MAENDAPQQPQSIEDRISAVMAPEAAPEPPAESAEPPAEGAPEPAQEGAAEAAEAAEDAAATEESAASAEPAEGEEEVLEIGADGLTPQDLADALGISVEDFYENATVPVNTPEGRRMVKLGEWKDGWQTNTAATKLRSELTEQRAAIEAERQQAQQQMQHQIAEAAGLAEQMQAAMLAPFNDVDWATLKVEDPGGWAAKRQELQEASAKVQAMTAQVQQKIAQHQRELSVQQQEQMNALLLKEREALIAADPEYGNAEQAPVKMQRLRSYLQGQGFSEQEVANAADHRLILMAEKARLWDESQAAAAPLKKRVVKVAKAGKPGARQSKAEQQHDATRELRTRLRKSGHVDDAAALISQMNRR